MNSVHALSSKLFIQKLVMISGVFLITIGFQTASAQTKYKTWTDPNAPASSTRQQSSGDLQKLVDELNKAVNEAERARAADPSFLRDLKDIARRYDTPWRVDLVNENFSDGDFTSNPTWQATSGRWWVEKIFGLRAAFEKSNDANNASQQRNDDIGKQLLGAILNQALGGNQQRSSGRSSSTSRSSSRAAIHLERKISNAFSLQIEFTSWRKEGTFEIVTYQGAERKVGYRLF